MTYLNTAQLKRFREKFIISSNDECWQWTAAKWLNGYGQVNVNGKMIGAHRLSWIIKNGAISPKLCVLHKCDNPSCVNPNHLFLGTRKDNITDRDKKGRGVRGERHPRAVLRDNDVKEIKSVFSGGRGEVTELAKRYKVTTHVICEVLKGRSWKHISC